MNSPEDEIYRWLVYFGIPGTILTFVGLLIYLVLNIPKLEALGAFFARLFARWSKRSEKKYIELDLQSKIGGFSQTIAKEIGRGKLPSVKIEWVDVEHFDRQAFFRKGQLVLRMSTYKNQEENVVHATIAYIRKTVLYRARNYFHRAIDKSIDLTVANKLFSKDSATLEYFQEELVRPVVQTDAELRQYLHRFAEIDRTGHFTRILLHELSNFADKFPRMARVEDIAETKNFSDFLFRIATEKIVPLEFYGRTIKVGVVLIARKGQAQVGADKPYLRAVDVDIRKGARTIYLCSWGKDNVSFAKEIIQELKRDMRIYFKQLQEYQVEFADGPPAPAVCASFRSVV